MKKGRREGSALPVLTDFREASASMVANTIQKVVIVVDRKFAGNLGALAESEFLWVIDSPFNSAAIREFWSDDSGRVDIAGGVTSFAAADDEPADVTCARLLEDVDEHHNEWGPEAPWLEIEVHGIQLTPALRVAFEEFGGTTFERTPGGFICRRGIVHPR